MTKFKKLTREQILNIHLALHNGSTEINIDGRNLAILKAPNGCNRVFVNDLEFITQNHKTMSKYSDMARNGHKISWGRNPKDLSSSWIYCHNLEINIPETYKTYKNEEILQK